MKGEMCIRDRRIRCASFVWGSVPVELGRGVVQHALLVTKVTNLYDMASKKYPQPTSIDERARLIRQACALVARSAMERQGISKRDPVSYTHLDVYKRQL